MSISEQKLQHLASLSSFELSETEVKDLSEDVNRIVDYISQLNQIDTEGVEPTYQTFEMENIWREDEIVPQEANREDLLATAPDTQDHQIKVPKVL